MNYIKSPRGGRQSPFSAALDGDERENLLLHRGKLSFVVMNKYPYNCGHLLVLPQREVADPLDLNGDESVELWRSVLLCEKVLRRTMKPDGFNIGFNIGSASGAGLPKHLHCHVVPRWDGDTNFMPVIGEIKVLPQALEHLYDQLLPIFSEEAGTN
ncbi:MAG: HIT domain-containing protein [Puniceicoccales bacterium]|nr:HIT domain-containing protein [Puniceicoccales bacterium]